MNQETRLQRWGGWILGYAAWSNFTLGLAYLIVMLSMIPVAFGAGAIVSQILLQFQNSGISPNEQGPALEQYQAFIHLIHAYATQLFFILFVQIGRSYVNFRVWRFAQKLWNGKGRITQVVQPVAVSPLSDGVVTPPPVHPEISPLWAQTIGLLILSFALDILLIGAQFYSARIPFPVDVQPGSPFLALMEGFIVPRFSGMIALVFAVILIAMRRKERRLLAHPQPSGV